MGQHCGHSSALSPPPGVRTSSPTPREGRPSPLEASNRPSHSGRPRPSPGVEVLEQAPQVHGALPSLSQAAHRSLRPPPAPHEPPQRLIQLSRPPSPLTAARPHCACAGSAPRLRRTPSALKIFLFLLLAAASPAAPPTRKQRACVTVAHAL